MYQSKWILRWTLVASVVLVVSISGHPRQAAQTTVGQSTEQSAEQSTAQSSGQAPQTAGANNAENEIATRIPDAQIKVHVNLVLVRAVVRDATGKEVAGLKKEDFRLLDNGQEQRITTLNEETAETRRSTAVDTTAEAKVGKSSSEDVIGASEAPTPNAPKTEANTTAEGAGTIANTMPQRFVALVFDDLHMKANESLAVRAATEKLFASLAPTDRAAVYSTSGEVQQNFTGDAEALRKALATVIPGPAKGEQEHECPNITYYMADLIYNKLDPDALTNRSVHANPYKT